MHQI
jgi:hypothetical protein